LADAIGFIIIGALAGAAGTLGVELVRHRLQVRLKEDDRREWYSQQLFLKRIEAAQAAEKWLRRIDNALIPLQRRRPEQDERDELERLEVQINNWLDEQRMFVPEGLAFNIGGAASRLTQIGFISWDQILVFTVTASKELTDFKNSLRGYESSDSVAAREHSRFLDEQMERFGFRESLDRLEKPEAGGGDA
jgi:hypothetical protein